MRKIILLAPVTKTAHTVSILAIPLKESELQKAEQHRINLQLSKLNKELQQVIKKQSAYIKDLNKILVMISHSLRQPIAQIIGLCHLFSGKSISKKEQGKIAGFMKNAVSCLDDFTKELNAFVQSLITKLKKR
jgi:light-regulated signal transduction histidine kinase (bacteriophytochrome)